MGDRDDPYTGSQLLGGLGAVAMSMQGPTFLCLRSIGGNLTYIRADQVIAVHDVVVKDMQIGALPKHETLVVTVTGTHGVVDRAEDVVQALWGQVITPGERKD